MTDFLPIIAFIIILAVTIIELKDSGQQIGIWRSVGVIASFFITIAIAVLLIEFGGRGIAGFITNRMLMNIVCLILTALVIFVLSKGLTKMVKRLINRTS